MNYDKNSFLAGISVGRTLKGWAAGSDGFSGGNTEGGGIICGEFKLQLDGVVLPDIICGAYEEVTE